MLNKRELKIRELLTRGVEKVIERKSLLKKLRSKKCLRIKHGVDPTGPKIHIGRAISFWKLKDFQDLGHQVVLIIGDFTARVGDASDKQVMRRSLSKEEVQENMKDYTKQIGKILDMDKVELRYNSEWLNKIRLQEFLSLSRNFTAQQMIQRRNFKQRWEQAKPIGLHELSYPLLQGYDSVAVKADVEIGGFDQLFNLMIGRRVQQIYGQQPQDIITFQMLYGLDGRKMSTTWANVVNIVDPPDMQYGKLMSMKDELIINYFKLATKVPMGEIKQIENGLSSGHLNPKDVKARLAKEVVGMYHGLAAAQAAKQEFERVFKERKAPSEIKKFFLKQARVDILDLLVKTQLASSRAQAKRLIQQGGVRVSGGVIKKWPREVKIVGEVVVQVGRRKFIKVVHQED